MLNQSKNDAELYHVIGAACRSRANWATRKGDEQRGAAGADPGWFFAPGRRDRGSLHSDVWEGTATALAARYAIAVYPPTVGGAKNLHSSELIAEFATR